MKNTLLLDLDLVFRRPVPEDDELADIAFEDMEPVDHTDTVGVHPLEATALIPFPPYDLVGVPPASAIAYGAQDRPFDARPARLSPEELPTEEYYREVSGDGALAAL